MAFVRAQQPTTGGQAGKDTHLTQECFVFCFLFFVFVFCFLFFVFVFCFLFFVVVVGVVVVVLVAVVSIVLLRAN